jgi:hypothetical protein
MPLAALAALFAAPTLTEAEDAAIDAAVATLADPDAEPVEVPTPASCMSRVGAGSDARSGVTPGETEPDAEPALEADAEADLEPDRHALSLLRDHLQREANAANLPVRFYIRERAEHEERVEAPAVEGRRRATTKPTITIVPAAVIAARVKVTAPKG